MQLSHRNHWFAKTAIIICSTTFCLSANATYDMSEATTQSITEYVTTLPEHSQQKIDVYHRMIASHLNQNFSIVRTVRILTAHYPQDVREILVAAYQQRPKQLTIISRAVIRSEAALTNDVLDTALTVSPDAYEEIVRMAINAEPAYIDDIVAVAAQHQPQHLDEIVRVAITAEPDLSGSVIQSAAHNSPSDFFNAVVSTITSIPESTKNVFYAVKDFFTGEQQDSETAVAHTNPEQWQQFLLQAKAQGVTKEEMVWFREQGYITQQQLAAVYGTNK